MDAKETEITRKYIISSKAIKSAFGLKGDLISIELYAGLNSFEEDTGKSHDEDTWEVTTTKLEKK